MKENTKKYNSDITKEDLQALGDKAGNLRNDNGEDELLKNKVTNDFSGKDLDVPGRKARKEVTKKTLKDEENQLYSIGSDDNENLEIDTINHKDK
ncbi:hypothetical protein [Polaribacter sp. Hel_I_88]|uniref:hypothetical protein n=1 Tax=Polaribacter sp. Hel_I_88 TaxID=1250006 RepID=UPI00056CC349|nr:hypothetical protein [Polaribacter sp. Hel_I_88]